MKFYIMDSKTRIALEWRSSEYNDEAMFDEFRQLGVLKEIIVDPAEGCVYGIVSE